MQAELAQILLVDDHQLLRKGLIKILNANGFTDIIEAANGEELLVILKNTSPDIILLDLYMPKMNGFESIKHIKKVNPHAKVLVVSMLDDKVSIIQMIKSGVDGYLLKDSDPKEIIEAIQIILEGGNFYSSLVNERLNSVLLDNDYNKDQHILSERELEFLTYASSDLTYKQIAEKMFVSVRTIDGYRDSIYQKFNIKTRIGLVIFALKNKLINYFEI
jgi:two-component system invasion response regulator UvrY